MQWEFVFLFPFRDSASARVRVHFNDSNTAERNKKRNTTEERIINEMKKEKLLYFEKMNKWDENDQNHFSDEILNIFYTFFFQLPPLISAIISFPLFLIHSSVTLSRGVSLSFLSSFSPSFLFATRGWRWREGKRHNLLHWVGREGFCLKFRGIKDKRQAVTAGRKEEKSVIVQLGRSCWIPIG